MKKLFCLLFSLITLVSVNAQNRTSAETDIQKLIIKPGLLVTQSDVNAAFNRLIAFADSARFQTFSSAQIKAMPNAYVQLVKVFYCNDKYRQGFWRYDPTDNTSVDNVGTIWVTNGGLRLKRDFTGPVFLSWFAKGDGVTSDQAAIMRCLQYVTDAYWSSTANRPSAYSRAEARMVEINGAGLSYKCEQPITLPTPSSGGISRLGEFTLKNALFIIGDSLAASGKSLFELYNGEGISINDVTVSGKAGDVTGRKAFNLTGVCVDVCFDNVKINEVERGIVVGDTCFDVRIYGGSFFRNFGTQAATNFIEYKGTDGMVNNVFLVNVETPIILRNANHIITNNHFYGVTGLYGLDIQGSSIGTRVVNNYFDGCSLRADRYGVGLYASNFFQNMRLYTPYVFYSSGGSYVPANMIISGNTIAFYQERTPIVSVNFTYNSGGTITVNSGVSLTQNHIGGIIEINPGQRIQIWRVNSSTNADVKRMSTSDLVIGTTYTADLNPTNILYVNNEAQFNTADRPGLVVHDNTMTINNSTGLTTLNQSVVYYSAPLWYLRATYKSDAAMLFQGLGPITFQRSTYDAGSLLWKDFSNVTKNAIGEKSGDLFFKNGTGTNTGLRLSATYIRPEAPGILASGGIGYEWSGVYSQKFQLAGLNTAPASATDTGTPGEIRIWYSGGVYYIGFCPVANTWVRAPLTSW